MAWLNISSRTEAVPIERGGWLDALRFIMAFLLILHHYRFASPIPLASLHPVFDRGYLLTDFFLIDSGYVLARVYAHRVAGGGVSFAAFVRKRAFRVIPAHLIVLFGLIGIMGVGALAGVAPRHPEWFDWAQLPSQIFLLQAYGVPGGAGWNMPTWSISALLGCYLCFPLFARQFTRISPWAALAAGVILFVAANALTWHFLGFGVYGLPYQYGIIRALPLFILGVTLARVGESIFIPAKVARLMGFAASGALIAVQAFGDLSLLSLALIAVLIIAAGAIPVIRKSRLIEKAAIVSFSMYITNEVFRIGYFGVVNVIEGRFALPVSAQWALWGGGVVVAVAGAFAFHYLVDMPTQRWLKPWALGRRQPRPVGGLEPASS